MNILIFTIHDNKAQAFIPPFLLTKIEMAIRTFSECANDPMHMFCKHPQDFTLYQIGEFNDETAEIISYPRPINLGMAIQFKNTIGE